MIKSIGLAVRREGMPVEEFQAYWREVHAPLATRVPGLRRYIQCHVEPDAHEAGHPPPFDGVAHLWFESVATYEAARETPEWAALAADAPNFLGAGGQHLLVTEVPIVDALPRAAERAGMLKRFGFLRRREGMSVEAFQAYWRDVHAPLVVAALPNMRRYVQSHVLPETYAGDRPPFCDGVVETWWDSAETDQLAERDGRRPSSPAIDDLVNFAAPRTTLPLVAREVVVVE